EGTPAGNLNECSGIGSDPSLGPIPIPNTSNPTAYYFPADQIAFGPGAQWVVTPWPPLAADLKGELCKAGRTPINCNRPPSGVNLFTTGSTGDINGGGSFTALNGSNAWANVLYRFSAAIDFAGGRSETPFSPGSTGSTSEMTKSDETAFFLLKDSDFNLVGD